jgi:hypothetical protein
MLVRVPRWRPGGSLVAIALASSAWTTAVAAQDSTARVPDVVCASKLGGRQNCAANTGAGVTLLRETGTAACVLGTTWGYDQKNIWVSDGCSGEFAVGRGKATSWGAYTPGVGFNVVKTDKGILNFSVYTYVRYLNQMGLDPTYTDAFGNTVPVQQRQDIQFQKVILYFRGWLLSPRFRYLTYVWSTNTSQGQSAQVVVAGNLSYQLNDHFTVGAGINGLPGVRSTEGNFPYWLPVDNRLIADEFFRPSYTTGIWSAGSVVERLNYAVMLGNNLSQLGVDAGQLDNGLNTVSGALVWLPSTGEFGTRSSFGDFEDHQKLATRFAAHYTYSMENYQGQPTTSSFENVQIRISNGGIIFAPDLFGPGVWVQNARYQMASLDAGLKYHGLSLDAGFYARRVDSFRGPGTGGLSSLRDNGFQVLASAMPIKNVLQVYAGGSKIYGEYGDPSDARVGLNWYPWKNQVARWNVELLKLNHSPVGGLALPYPVGGNGNVFYTSLEVYF